MEGAARPCYAPAQLPEVTPMLRAALAVLLLAAAPALAQDITIEDPYAITPVPGAPSGGAYMTIQNHGATPDRLVEARSPVAEHVMLHTHQEVDGVMRMREAEDGLDLPAEGTLLLGRGEAHVMFMGITDPFEDGDLIPLTLVFEQAGEIAVEVPVDLSRATQDPAAEGQAHGAQEPEAHDGHGAAAHEGH
jgi:hypothetical protein